MTEVKDVSWARRECRCWVPSRRSVGPKGPDHLEVVQERPEEALVSAPGTGDKAPPVAPVLSRIPAIRFS